MYVYVYVYVRRVYVYVYVYVCACALVRACVISTRVQVLRTVNIRHTYAYAIIHATGI